MITFPKVFSASRMPTVSHIPQTGERAETGPILRPVWNIFADQANSITYPA
jgi:hypothetical protein